MENLSMNSAPAAIMKSYTAEDHRRRLLNIQAAEKSIRKCLKTHLITNYLPGQVSYNIGEYPSLQPYDPDEYDECELERLSNNGIQLLQIMEDWNDLLRLHGADRFSSPNPAGLRRFIQMAHRHGIKVLLYASTGYMQEDDPDMRDEWTRETSGNGNHAAHWKLIRCSPASAGWRAYVLQKTIQVLDDYEADGLYNDWGYVPNNLSDRLVQPVADKVTDEVLAFHEIAVHDAAEEDLMALVFAEVKRRGRIYKMHADFNNRPMTCAQLYDYLWVGEGIGDLNKMREETKTHPPYVIPSFDCRYGNIENEDHQYLHTIPYLQFPQLLAGRPFTGQRAMIPGVHYRTEDEDELLHQWREQWRYYQAHPDGPHIYGPWDKSPARPGIRETHAKWLKQYRVLVEEGSYAYLEISDSDLFAQALPADVVASLFVNLETYLVLANYTEKATEVVTVDKYVPLDDARESANNHFALEPLSLLILRRI
jgi:hypothetical protein